MWHFLIGKNKHDENINLCGRPGAATNMRKAVTCNKCRTRLHMKKIKLQTNNESMLACPWHCPYEECAVHANWFCKEQPCQALSR
jgi:hypothetical protein